MRIMNDEKVIVVLSGKWSVVFLEETCNPYIVLFECFALTVTSSLSKWASHRGVHRVDALQVYIGHPRHYIIGQLYKSRITRHWS